MVVSAPQMPDKTNVTGVLLAGGLGRRMSIDGHGTDKGLLAFRGKPLARHVIDRVIPQVSTLLINTGPDSDPWRSFGLPLVADLVPGRVGPLAGLHAAMTVATTPWVLSVPCDTPFLPSNLLERLANAQKGIGADRVSVRCGEQSHPVIALVRSELASGLRDYLEKGGRRIEAWLASGRWAQADFDDEEAFANLNTPEELRRLEAL